MAIEFIIKEGVMADIMEIVEWYDFKKKGLGERFYKELLNEFEKIQLAPKAYYLIKMDFRRAILKHFPYLIIFKFNEQEIINFAVIYGGRNPQLVNQKID